MSLNPTTTTVTGPALPFYLPQYAWKLDEGVTIDRTKVPTGSDGKRIVKAGAALGKITATGKFGPYDDGASDGREVGVGLAILGGEAQIDVTSEDLPVGLLVGGIVFADMLGADVDAGFKTDNPRIFYHVK